MNIENTHITSIETIISPNNLKTQLPLMEEEKIKIIKWRQEIDNIIKGNDDRLIVIMGPCSIHDIDAAIEYANKLKILKDQVNIW